MPLKTLAILGPVVTPPPLGHLPDCAGLSLLRILPLNRLSSGSQAPVKISRISKIAKKMLGMEVGCQLFILPSRNVKNNNEHLLSLLFHKRREK